MHSDLEIVSRKAEFDYLQQPELDAFKQCVDSLRERLEIYECLRDKEIDIFQLVAEQLLDAYPLEEQKLIERALKYWISIMRYSAMAMLLNNPGFLQHRLLEWLTPVFGAYQLEEINNSLYGLLLSDLSQTLTKKQMTFLQPFLEQAKANLANDLAPQLSGV
jgi:hypothetical protein